MRAVLVLQPGTSGSDDVLLAESIPSTPLGTSAMTIGTILTNDLIGIIRFDLSALPRGARVVSATLSLYNANPETTTRHFAAYAILPANSGWTEGATWDYAVPSFQRWAGDAAANGGSDAGCSVSGTDYAATAVGVWTYTANDPADTVHTFAIDAATVQRWADGANDGLVLRLASGSGTVVWWSNDAPTSTVRPKLTITYDHGGVTLARFFDPHTGRPLRDIVAWR